MKFRVGDMVRYLMDTDYTVSGLYIVMEIIENEERTDTELVLIAPLIDLDIATWYYANRYSLVQRPD